MTPKEKEFIKLIKNTFKECYEVRPHLYKGIEGQLMRLLPEIADKTEDEKVAIEDMKARVAYYFDDPSSFDTGPCSKLFMDAIKPCTFMGEVPHDGL